MENMGRGGMSHAGDPSGPLCAHGSHLEIKGITPQHIDSTVWGQCRTRSPLDMRKRAFELYYLDFSL